MNWQFPFGTKQMTFFEEIRNVITAAQIFTIRFRQNDWKIATSGRSWISAVIVSFAIAPVTALAQSPSDSNSKSFAHFLMLVEEDFGPKETDSDKSKQPSNTADQQSSQQYEQSVDVDLEQAQIDENTTLADGVQYGIEPSLTLSDVIASLYRAYPEISRARLQPQVAGGQLLSANGAYDTKFKAHALAEPTGFYENYRSGLGVARQTWWGGQVAAGYRIGRGSFQPWYKERQTDDAGEFKFAVTQPLLQGRAIDPERVAVFQASLDRDAAGPMIQQAILESARAAALVYWQWVSAGNVMKAQRELLELAEKRGEQFETGVKAGKFPEIDLILNQQLIAERRAQLLEGEQKFREVSFKLSLYLRDDMGQPMVPTDAWLPDRFPSIQPRNDGDFQDDWSAALSRRPEPQILRFEIRKLQWDRQLACNQMLPRLDFITEASQDMGEPASKSDDKGQFELLVGITSEVPIQRRKARGKLQSTAAKISQTNQKIRLVRDKIGAELRTARNALDLSSQVVEQTKISLRAAVETLDRYRFAFERGKIDLIYLNLIETKANETEIKLVKAQREWFTALSEMQAALGLDPLDQAVNIAALPESEMLGPEDSPIGIEDSEEAESENP